MARLSRVVVPDVPHHVTQRGNRRLPIFFGDEDRALYLDLLRAGCATAGVTCLAWCLMDNHVHLILVPHDPDGLRAALGEAHRRYTRHINLPRGWRGYLFQGRFASLPVDDPHLMAAVRYVENNPVASRLVERAEQWRWSSARAHVAGRSTEDDRLTDVAALAAHVADWAAMLRHGLKVGGSSAEVAAAIEARLSTGRPLAADAWIAEQERRLARPLGKRKPGPRKSDAVRAA